MSDEIKTGNTENPEPELSADELDQVAGGFSWGESSSGGAKLKTEWITSITDVKKP